jgi:hypothetical protein
VKDVLYTERVGNSSMVRQTQGRYDQAGGGAWLQEGRPKRTHGQ